MIATGGRQLVGFACGDAHESWPWGNPDGKYLIRGNGRVDCAVGHSRRNCRAADAAQQSSLKRFVVGRIGADQISDTARQDVAENSEAGAERRYFGSICHAIAVLGCRIASGVEENKLPR